MLKSSIYYSNFFFFFVFYQLHNTLQHDVHISVMYILNFFISLSMYIRIILKGKLYNKILYNLVYGKNERCTDFNTFVFFLYKRIASLYFPNLSYPIPHFHTCKLLRNDKSERRRRRIL
ncbi:hypothetical protein PUN28_003597 [Cardiocondyla obscurior]|uniref:Uncharacterized protein n=1 Tax=Cardiocondyla obscurior TaxID=286306 RepID=A0AAW2GNY0_9HYME